MSAKINRSKVLSTTVEVVAAARQQGRRFGKIPIKKEPVKRLFFDLLDK